MPTAKEICDSIGDHSLLNSTVEDIHLDHLAKEMTGWREIAPSLEITPPEEEGIMEKHQGNLILQNRKALRKWREKLGPKASYRKLIIIFCAEGKVDLAETVKYLLTVERSSHSDSAASSINVIDDFHGYISECYTDLPDQPPASLPWPHSCSNLKYVDLDLLDVPVNSAPDSVEHYKHIELSSLFTIGDTKAKRKVILVEGVAGAGKTTLSWYVCKQWVAGKLFEDIKLLIHVSLNDPAATKLADLIPHHNERMRATIAEAIIDTRGKRVCFWLDSCDEAPQALWDSFLHRFVAGSGKRATLPNANIILTSRPQVSAKLTTVLTGKVVIRGFPSLHQFVAACLPDNGDQLLAALDMKPELYSLCHLPLNAAILVCLYDTCKYDLPTTRTGLFHPLVSNFVVRHMLQRTTHGRPDVTNFPVNLPDDIRSSFDKVAKLAYTSLLQRKMIMDRSALTECGISTVDDALGFIVARLRFTLRGPTDQFSFTHSSLQEFLAAFHISSLNMDENQQLRAIRSIFGQNPNSPVLAFFAGLTELVVEEVWQMFFRVLVNPSSYRLFDVKKLQLAEGFDKIYPSDNPRRRLLCLMNCLYEAQNPELFSQVKLNDLDLVIRDLDLVTENNLDFSTGEPNLREFFITFSFISLYPIDCLSLGYFLQHIYIEANVHRVYLDLSYALIGDREIRALTQELRKPTHSHDPCLNIDIRGVPISTNSLHCISTLFNHESCLAGLILDIRLINDMCLAMKYIVEGFSRSHCFQLTVEYCSSKITHYLLLLLYQPVHLLDLSYSVNLFTAPDSMHLFCEAMKYSQLKRLTLSACGINNESLMLLASSICHDNFNFLKCLNIDHNPYTDPGLTNFLRLMLERLPFVHLTTLSVNHLNNEHLSLVHEINFFRIRKQEYCPKLVVSCETECSSQDKQFKPGTNDTLG